MNGGVAGSVDAHHAILSGTSTYDVCGVCGLWVCCLLQQNLSEGRIEEPQVAMFDAEEAES